MRLFLYTVGLGALSLASLATAQTQETATAPAPEPMISVRTTNDLGMITNGPATLQLFRITQSWTNARPLPPRLATNATFLKTRPWFNSSSTWTNAEFRSFRSDSLNYAVWTNFIAHTNGRTMQIWSERIHPASWPADKPLVRWNTNSLLWGMKGLTALSPCWSGEGFAGQVPLTALTRRHAYTRGHGTDPDGFHAHRAGSKAWFLTRDNQLVEAVIKRHVTRISATNGVPRDYMIVLFDRDLPSTIDSMAVLSMNEIQGKYRFGSGPDWPCPIFQTEQSGLVSTGIAPFITNTWKPGDSGSPNMIPIPGELVFFSGRSTTGPSRQMQEDMDELCRLERLDPKKYQLRRPDLSKYPDF